MLSWLVETAIKQRVLVVALAIVLLVQGARIAEDTPLDVFPEFAPPRVEIQTEAPGMSTEEVDALVTVPLESSMFGLPGLDTVRSKSVLGLSSIVLYFERGSDLLQARQHVQERLAIAARTLPQVVSPPTMLAPLSALSRAMKIGLSSESLSLTELSLLAQWTIRPRLMSVLGVANVAIWGERERQLQVLVDPDRLALHDVTLAEVVRAASNATRPAPGGFVDLPNQRLPVRLWIDVENADDLARIAVADRGARTITLGDVTQVVEGHPPLIGEGVINDGPGLLLIVEKQPDANTLSLTQGVEAALETLRPALAGVEVDSTIFRPATFIELSLANLRHALWLGCALVAIVLIAFLFDWRTALISLTAIPTSLLTAALVLHYQGSTINTMVLAGLIIALGEVVDDAIIDVENIVRRLRLNRASPTPRPAHRVVLEASLEVRSAVVFGSVIVALVVLPIFFLEGLSGAFFRPLASSYVIAIFASLLTALVLTPALSMILLPRGTQRTRTSPLVRGIQQIYHFVLALFLRRTSLALALFAVTLGGTIYALPHLERAFLPNFKERDFLMHWVEKPGTSIDAMRRITIAASRELRSIEGVRNFGAHIGRAQVADEVVGPNFTELWISVSDDVDYDETVARIQEVVDGYPGLYRDLLTYLRERVKEVLTGTSATIVVRIFGPELDVLRAEGRAVQQAIADVEGIVDLKLEPQVLVPQVHVRVRPADAQRFGVDPAFVRDAVETFVHGRQVGEVFEDQRVFRVVVMGEPGLRDEVTALRDLRIRVPRGALVPLSDLASIEVANSPNTIQREGGSRRIDVTCNVRGRDLAAVATEIEARCAKLAFPTGYHPEFLGEYKEAQESSRRLAWTTALCWAFIVLLLVVEFHSLRLAFMIVLGFPLALSGGVLAALLDGGVLSLGSIIGFVTVMGIAARNGIMLISHYRHLEREEGMTFSRELVLRGSLERVAPILMTGLTTMLALLPVVLGRDLPGHEIEHPMAMVILGGLASSILLNLLVIPVAYLRFGKPSRASHSETQALDD